MELWLAYFLGLRSSIFIYIHIAILIFILTGEGLAAIRKGVPPPEPSAIHKVPHSRLRTHPQLHSLNIWPPPLIRGRGSYSNERI